MSETYDPRPGEAVTLAPGLRVVLCPNPSPMTFHGTNTFLLGKKRLAIIDPGPQVAAHEEALVRAVGAAEVSHILVTHSHVDHSPLAGPLARRFGAPVLAFGDSRAGRSPVMDRLAGAGLAGGGEGVDAGFVPDQVLQDGAVIGGDGWDLEAIHTPGHMGNHLAFRWGRAVFVGDLVMGWASSLVSPPDGDLADFMASCRRLKTLSPEILYAGHGAPITSPVDRLDWLMNHRMARSDQIVTVLRDGPADLSVLTERVYTDVPKAMHPAAARNLFAHLVQLDQDGIVTATPELGLAATFTLKVSA